ncbi:hypothetical protein OUZ56_007177 [Daphnia magna]|uniref:Uncharacterized protein n=1 Tax=Daphnia magna TaxID=35525 RepID=A0ABQ9YXU0_9CRUS|nr:hypothetical protein OUZ56_007177 [Daphnia magna]
MLAWPSGDVINWPPGPSQFHLIGLISQRLAKAINTIPETPTSSLVEGPYVLTDAQIFQFKDKKSDVQRQLPYDRKSIKSRQRKKRNRKEEELASECHHSWKAKARLTAKKPSMASNIHYGPQSICIHAQ